MKTNYPYLITENSVVLLKGAKRLVAQSNHPLFAKIVDRIKTGQFVNIERLFEVKNVIEKNFGVEINNGRVLFRGKLVHNAVSNKLIDYLREGYNHKPLTRFLSRLLTRNPSNVSVDQLWEHISRYKFCLDSDGCFYSTKCIKDNWFDKYSGVIRNRIGDVVKMDRNLISVENTGNFCSSPGLYCGSLDDYVLGYYGKSPDRVVIVKVKPENVVAVATDHNYAKIRVCEYEVTHYLGTVEELKGQNLVEYSNNVIRRKDGKTDTRYNHLAQKRNKSGKFV